MVKRGEIWWADLGDPRGSSPALRRLVLVVQDDLLNASALHTAMVVPLTSNLRRAQAVGNVLLEPSETGLNRPSVALVCQVMTVDVSFFDECVGSLSMRVRSRIDRGLALALGLRGAIVSM
ncbi:MAG: type II toxin-antitoxin system PemK/MazF family toxin [Polyangiaceae bacterium]|nr:type II toxin-antitoxin system PemK/MazF family toxin [Polyangiaceae bacterium]